MHNSGYDLGKALQAIIKCPIPDGIQKKWSQDERKLFQNGMRQYGKNFFEIQRNLLPHKKTSELVSFYYLWKKTPAAMNPRTYRSHRHQIELSTTESFDTSSDDSDFKERQNYHCQHCYTTSESHSCILSC